MHLYMHMGECMHGYMYVCRCVGVYGRRSERRSFFRGISPQDLLAALLSLCIHLDIEISRHIYTYMGGCMHGYMHACMRTCMTTIHLHQRDTADPCRRGWHA